MTTWWASLYDDAVADLLLEREPAAVQRTSAFLIDVLDLGDGACVFDQCCGIGQIADPLHAAGVRVIGIDQSGRYIERAQQRAPAGAKFSVADGFEYVTGAPCDGAFNWSTSFGYADSDSVNQRMLACAYRSLKPGARFALDFMNLPQVLSHFQRDMVTEGETGGCAATMTRRTRLDLTAGLMIKDWTILTERGERKHTRTQVRLYLPHQLGAMLKAVGFARLTYYGGEDGQSLTPDSPRCIIVAER